MITVIGIFENADLADSASSYLLANEFTNEKVDVHTNGDNADGQTRIESFFSHLFDNDERSAHYAALGRQGTIVTVHAVSAREAQEAVDALNNYGAINVNAADERTEGIKSHSQIIERIVDGDKRLRG